MIGCDCGRVFARLSDRTRHIRRCPVYQRWLAIAYSGRFALAPIRETEERYRRASAEVATVLRSADALLRAVIIGVESGYYTARGVHRFADLHAQFDANELLVPAYLHDDPDRDPEHLNAITARFDQLLAEESLYARTAHVRG